MTNQMPKFLRKNGEFLSTVIERAKSRHKFQELKGRGEKGKKQKRQRIEKLFDANERKIEKIVRYSFVRGTLGDWWLAFCERQIKAGWNCTQGEADERFSGDH